MEFADIGGLRLAYEIRGSGQNGTVVLAGGSGMPPLVWEPIGLLLVSNSPKATLPSLTAPAALVTFALNVMVWATALNEANVVEEAVTVFAAPIGSVCVATGPVAKLTPLGSTNCICRL